MPKISNKGVDYMVPTNHQIICRLKHGDEIPDIIITTKVDMFDPLTATLDLTCDDSSAYRKLAIITAVKNNIKNYDPRPSYSVSGLIGLKNLNIDWGADRHLAFLMEPPVFMQKRGAQLGSGSDTESDNSIASDMDLNQLERRYPRELMITIQPSLQLKPEILQKLRSQ